MNSDRKLAIQIISICIINLCLLFSAHAETNIRIGYFEGGKYPVHDLLRTEFQRQLDITAPDGYKALFIPQGFRSAEWDRKKSKLMATQLANLSSTDIMIAMGPWAVEDLLEAGYKKPIIALHRFHPPAEGLLDETGKPKAANLSLGFEPSRIETDLQMMSRLIKIRKLAVLYFPTGDESDLIVERCEAIGKKLGFEVVATEGFDNKGTYAFFRALIALDRKVNAVYLPPLWGLDIAQIKELLSQAAKRKLFVFTSEGQFVVERGAAASNSGYTFFGPARHAANNLWKIVAGQTPSELPIIHPVSHGLSINLKAAGELADHLPMNAINEAFVISAPDPDELEIFSLPLAINRALEKNPGYLAKYDALQAAVQAVSEARSGYLPHINATGEISAIDDNSVNNSPAYLNNEQYSVSLNFDQTIFSMETKRSIELARQKSAAGQIDLNQAAIDLERAVTIAYLNFLQADELNRVRQQNRQLIDRNLEITEGLRQLGEKSRTDFLRWENERSIATRILLSARARYQAARITLASLLNLPPDAVFLLEPASFDVKSFWSTYEKLNPRLKSKAALSGLANELTQSAIDGNIGLKRSRQDISIRQSMLSANSAGYWPKIGFNAGLNYDDRQNDQLGFEEKRPTWSVTGYIKLPLFLGNRRKHEKGRLKSELSQFEFEHDQNSLRLLRKIRSSLPLLSAQAANVALTIRSQDLTRENFELLQLEYQGGTLPIEDLIEATKLVAQAESEFVLTRYGFFQTMASIFYDLGWSTDGNRQRFDHLFTKRVSP